MPDEAFKALLNKDVYEFLEGNGKQDLVIYRGVAYGLPYLTGTTLAEYCSAFGVYACGSRWNYVEALITYAVDTGCIDEVLGYFFELARFTNLQVKENDPRLADEPWLASMDEVEEIHRRIIPAAVKYINWLIRFTHHELYVSAGHFYMKETGKKVEISTTALDVFDSGYAVKLRVKCLDDLERGNYDSVITKSRTLMEETLVHIVEKAREDGLTTEEVEHSGDLVKLYNQVKTIKNMRQNKCFDRRINDLLNGLEKIVHSVAEMRNVAGDVHGLGERRITVNAREARLVMNAALMFCEYMAAEKDSHEICSKRD